MCKLCTEALEIVKKEEGKKFAMYWIWNLTGYPFWGGKQTLEEAKRFAGLSKKERRKFVHEVETKDMDEVTPLHLR